MTDAARLARIIFGHIVEPGHRDLGELVRRFGAVETLELASGDWTYRCDGPVRALVELARGRGKNLSPGSIGAATAATIAAMLNSSRAGGTAQPVLGGST